MNRQLIVLRPEPGAGETAARAERAGWDVIIAPLFTIAPRAWAMPAVDDFDALMMTSANAARHGGEGLAQFGDLPLYAVGKATAKAAEEAGFENIRVHGPNAGALADALRADRRSKILHLAGEEARPFDESGLMVTRIAVYAARPAEPPGLAEALSEPVVALLHSPRAAGRFADWCNANRIARASVAIAAISPAALHEAGGGWRGAVVAEEPRDAALIDAAARLA